MLMPLEYVILVLGFMVCFHIVRFVLSRYDAFAAALKLPTVFVGAALFVVLVSFLFKTPMGEAMAVGDITAMLVAGVLGIAGGLGGGRLLRWAATVLLASKLGLPVSTSHAAVGGVMGVGLARGMETVNFSIVFKIMLYWILTVPVAAITSMIVFTIFESIL